MSVGGHRALAEARERASELAESALETFGEEPQIRMVVEECAELIVAISHRDRGRADAGAGVVEELADVLVVTEQLAQIVGTDRVAGRLHLKLDRLEARIAERRDRDNVSRLSEAVGLCSAELERMRGKR